MGQKCRETCRYNISWVNVQTLIDLGDNFIQLSDYLIGLSLYLIELSNHLNRSIFIHIQHNII
eukprot:UN04458